ncbi:MAG: YkgJ family cysteine cluster protein [Acetobacterium woodii]|nr:YkgJ family cysteine cluster protein [Acetobacterium woodii]
MDNTQHISAGDFSAWLKEVRASLITEAGTAVNCGSCNACCTSSYFIHIQPQETKTLARINKRLLFPAPGLPKGNVLMGYDEQGRCPMLTDGRCSIYKNRAITCRIYDCRVFTAAGIDPGDSDKTLIKKRTDLWQFEYPTPQDRDDHQAVKAAATFITTHADCFPDGAIPHNPSQLAILAIKVYSVFSNDAVTSGKWSNQEIAQKIIKTNADFETSRLKSNHQQV